MSDLGLLMNADMALAWHEGRKTVTRRPISPQPLGTLGTQPNGWPIFDLPTGWSPTALMGLISGWAVIPGAGIARAGERVWCRETFHQARNRGHINENSEHVPGPWRKFSRYSGEALSPMVHADWVKRPSVHMPKWAARSWGEIVSVRPCDLSGIDDAEARLEGFETAADFLTVIRAIYSDARWYWRVEWKPIDRPGVRS